MAGAYVLFLSRWRERTLGWVQFGLGIAASVVLVILGGVGPRSLGILVGAITLMSMSARQFAKTTMRVTVAVIALLCVLLVARVGTAEVDDTRRAEAQTESGLDEAEFGRLCPSEVDGPACLVLVREAQSAAAAAALDDTSELADAGITEELTETLKSVSEAEGREELRDEVIDAREVVERALDRATSSTIDEALTEVDTSLRVALGGSTTRQIRGMARAALEQSLIAVDEDAAQAAADDAEADTEAASTAAEAGVPALELITAGADAIVDAWVSPVTQGDGLEVPAALGVTAWVLIGVAAILGYRRLEIRNNQSYGAPVAFSSLKVDGDDLSAEFLLEGTKARYGSTDLIEPPDTPGGSAFESVQTTLSETGGEHGKIAVALAKFAQATAFPKAGITVTGAVSEAAVEATSDSNAAPAEGADETKKPLLGVLRLETTHEHRFIRSERLHAENQTDLMDKAAALVAADVFGYSYWTPPWARSWGKQGEALATYRRMIFRPPKEADDRLRSLRTALGSAPGNGMIRLMLAHELDLAEKPVEALRLNLQNRIDHPHFLAGRYRLVTSLCMLADPTMLERHWWTPSAAEHRKEILRLIDAGDLLVEPMQTRDRPWWRSEKWWDIRSEFPSIDPAGARTALAEQSPLAQRQTEVAQILLWWAAYEADQIERSLGVWRLTYRALPQSERRVWLAILRSSSRRRRENEQIRSALPIIEARLRHAAARAASTSTPVMLDTEDVSRLRALGREVTAQASDRRVGTAALYNAACFWSVAAGMLNVGDEENDDTTLRAAWLDHSLTALEAALRTVNGSRPSLKWIEQDPDLAAVRSTPGWRHVKARLEEESP